MNPLKHLCRTPFMPYFPGLGALNQQLDQIT